MKNFTSTLSFLLILFSSSLFAQVNYTAKDQVVPFNEPFLFGSNFGFNPPWQDEDLANIAAGNPNVALVDLNSVLTEAATTGIAFDDFTLTTNLVTGGLVSLDGIHLTGKGYALMANKFLEALDASFGTNFIASGTMAKAVNYPTNYSPSLQ